MKITVKSIFGHISIYVKKLLKLPNLSLVSGIVCLCSFIVTLTFFLTNMDMGNEGTGNISDFEANKLADRDIIAEQAFSYEDTEATNDRKKMQESLVPAVFRMNSEITNEAINTWKEFCVFTGEIALVDDPNEDKVALVLKKYDRYFNAVALLDYFISMETDNFYEWGTEILTNIMSTGIFFVDNIDLGSYNPDYVELLVPRENRIERQQIDRKNITTLNNLYAVFEDSNYKGKNPTIIVPMLMPFFKENVFFSEIDTESRVNEALDRVKPVMKEIEEGKKIIRKGYVISELNMEELRAYHAAFPINNPGFRGISLILLTIMLYLLFILLQQKFLLGRDLAVKESCLLFIMACVYLVGIVLTKSLVSPSSVFPISIFFPTALMVMIMAVFLGSRLALIMAIVMPIGAFFTGFYDIYSLLFSLVSGITASTVLKNAEKRMDLIKAGLAVGAANCIAVVAILLMHTAQITEYPMMLFGAALNGFVSGMLLLGILPLLESALNAATTFRLIELSDLNAPILRKMFTTTPGTYSHSMMVAALAEQACHDIGANALLARVGAYYHDIGKMENPNYFVENQTDYNKHDDIAPRLSATVIRSHVKLGVEKSRSLGLPEDVINIIAEHHGNSVIAWFYKKATEKEEQVNTEDFTYPGKPPRSRESAIVMLADVTEAAVRTLVKPTVTKMDKFIQQLFDEKVEHGQLSQSELSFKDLVTIKNAFIKVLGGYYHSRIEYPKISPDPKGDAE